MFNVEFHRGGYCKGRSPFQQETSAARSIDAALASAKERARGIGADNIVITNPEGRVIGVFSTYSGDID
ncbi:MAG: hypothetical protein ACHP84_03985 [Caulobacterales bacterium]